MVWTSTVAVFTSTIQYRSSVWPLLRAHGDQHPAQQLDGFILEPAKLDQPIVLASRQRPDPLGLDE
jgi:hypothetical protein